MEAIAAFSFAANIIQVVHWGLEVVSVCKKVYESGQVDQVLGQVVASLNETAETLHKEISAQEQPITSNDHAIFDMARQCSRTANRLLEELNFVTGGGNAGKRRVILMARALFKKRTIEKLHKELTSYQEVLETQVLNDLRRKVDLALLRSSAEFDNIRGDIQNLILRIQEDKTRFDQILDKKIDFIYTAVKEIQTPPVQVPNTRDVHPPASYDKERVDYVLKSLFFPEISSREENVELTYPETYQWALASENKHTDNSHEATPNLLQWLKSGSGMFWVSGKAVSGKSTFIKFVLGDKRTRKAVGLWAGSKETIVASYFFWAQGMMLQQTQRGLLQTIHYQILSTIPRLIKFYDADPHCGVRQWTEQRLLTVFKTILTQTEIPIGLCLFVDGLDENTENPTEVLQLLCQMTQMKNFKCVISSRPWAIFHRMLKPYPQICLQELTKDDIACFIAGKIELACDINPLDKYQQLTLTESLASNAEGVFLWASLATASIVDGIRNGDDFKELLSRIAEFPPRLNEMYHLIVSRIDDRYKKQATRIFRLLQLEHPNRTLKVSVLSLALTDLGTERRVRSLEDNDYTTVLEDCNRTLLHIQQRCGSLLHVSSSLPYRRKVPTQIEDVRTADFTDVAFIHRTVHDFFHQSPEVLQFPSGASDRPWDPMVARAVSYIRKMCVFVGPVHLLSTVADFSFNGSSLALALFAIRRIQLERGDIPGILLEQLENQGKHLLRLIRQQCGILEDLHWSSLLSINYKGATKLVNFHSITSTLELYAMSGITQHVVSKLANLSVKQCTTLIHHTLNGLSQLVPSYFLSPVCGDAAFSKDFRARVELIFALLNQGADPNGRAEVEIPSFFNKEFIPTRSTQQETAWTRLLQIMTHTFENADFVDKTVSMWIDLVSKFLKHGANQQERVHNLRHYVRFSVSMSNFIISESDPGMHGLISGVVFNYEAQPLEILRNLIRDDRHTHDVISILQPTSCQNSIHFKTVYFNKVALALKRYFQVLFDYENLIHITCSEATWEVSYGALDHLATEILSLRKLGWGRLGNSSTETDTETQTTYTNVYTTTFSRTFSEGISPNLAVEVLKKVFRILDKLPPLPQEANPTCISPRVLLWFNLMEV